MGWTNLRLISFQLCDFTLKCMNWLSYFFFINKMIVFCFNCWKLHYWRIKYHEIEIIKTRYCDVYENKPLKVIILHFSAFTYITLLFLSKCLKDVWLSEKISWKLHFAYADEWNWTTDLLVTNQLLYPWATPALELKYHLWIFLRNPNKPKSTLDPNLKSRLLKESKNPFRGLRRALWIALFGSAALGFFIMFSKIIAGVTVPLDDFAIQTSALLILGFLLVKDRNKQVDD